MAQLDDTEDAADGRAPYRRWTEETRRGHDGEATSGTRRIAREFGNRVESRVNWTLEAAADRLEDTAGRIDRMTRGRAGAEADTVVAGRAGGLSHSVAGLMESTAEFLRTNNVESLRDELRGRMRERPLQTLMIGVVAGWAMGKILR